MSTHGDFELPAVSRRKLIVGGGMLFGGLFLTGCASSGSGQSAGARASTELPDDTYVGQMQPPAGTPNWQANIPSVPPTLPVYTPPPPSAPATAPAQVIPRSTWTRMGIARPREIYAIGAIQRITIHHDGMPPAALRSTRDVAARIEQIRAAHVNGRGWADIGYHYIVDPSGRVWEGRNIAYQGAHVKDQNENNLGILVLGNFEVQRPSPQALSTLDRFVVFNMQRYRIPLSRVRTHREIAKTECPGRNLQGYLVSSRSGNGAIAMNAARSGLARG